MVSQARCLLVMPDELPESRETIPLERPDLITDVDQGSLSLEVFSDPESISEIYRADPDNGESSLLSEFDSDGSFAELSFDSNVVKDGKVVREISQTGGNDTVIAYDAEGVPHRFEDTKIQSFPIDLSSIPQWRREKIRDRVMPLFKDYTEGENPDGGEDGEVSFHDMASIMKDISKMPDLTEIEKAQLWTDVARSINNGDVDITDADQKPETIDSWKGSWDLKHAVLGLNDGYHANRLINMSEKDASEAIRAHENGAEASNKPLIKSILWQGAKLVLGVNTGDINASEGALRALRDYRVDGTFAAFANAWEKEFVRPDIDQYGRKKN